MKQVSDRAALPPFSLRGWPARDLADPYPVYRRYRENATTHRAEGPDGEPVYYVFDHAGVSKVLTDRACTRADPARRRGPVPTSHPALHDMVTNWLVFLDPPRHTRLRSLLAKEFTAGVVTGLRPRLEAIARELVDDMAAPGVVELVESFAAPFPILVISELLGVPSSQRPWFRARAQDLQEASSSRAAVNPQAHDVADSAARELGAFFTEQIADRRRAPRDDLISLLAGTRRREEPLDDGEIVASCVHLLTAGHETTTNLVTKSMLTLAHAPHLAERLRATPALLPRAAVELMRHDPPVHAVTRWSGASLRLGEHDVEPGRRLVALLASANRDPARFPDPDAVDIDRPAAQHASFGMGIHYCLGAVLARAELEIALATLLAAFPVIRPAGELPRYPEDLVFHGPSSAPLEVESRVSGAGAYRTRRRFPMENIVTAPRGGTAG